MTASAARLRAAGPLGRVLTTDGNQLHRGDAPLRAEANALVLLRRVAFIDPAGALDEKAGRCLLHWAQDHALGQQPQLLRHIAQRRERAAARACQRPSASDGGREHRRIVVRPLWRLAVGLGNRTNPYEVGLSLHGTYGWPIIPGSTLKGVTCAYASTDPAVRENPQLFDRVFGLPRVGAGPAGATGASPDDETEDARAREGTVCFLDALPLGGPVQVLRDVVTPHVQPYYRDSSQPPAEYHNPIPVEYLVVAGGAFAVDLLGPAGDVDQAAAWCRDAIDDLGVGAKTSSGYGYLTEDRRWTR